MTTPPDPATLRALLARVEQATGADRKIDQGLAIAFDVNDAFLRYARNEAAFHTSTISTFELSGRLEIWEPQTYTASVDAALALVGRVMPDAFVTLDRYVVSDKSPESGIGDQWRT